MSLRRALGWSGVSAAVRIALGFFSAKVSAVYLGPAGMVLVGQLNNFLQVTAGAIGNGANTALVNLTPERAADRRALQQLWGSAMRLVLTIAAVAAVLLAFAAFPLSSWLFFNRAYWPVAMAAGLVILLAVADHVVTGALNGLKCVDTIARNGLLATLAEFLVFVALTYTFGVWGALVAMSSVYVVRLAVSCTVAFRTGLIAPHELFGSFDTPSCRQILPFYPMLLAHSIALPFALILIRSLVVRNVGLEQGGYLQAAWRLSDVYVTVLTTALGLYFMAQFSSITDEGERGAMLRRTLVQVAAVTAFGAAGIYLLREPVVRIVLTPRFMPMTFLLPLQLVGDVCRMSCYPLQMALVSRRRVATYITQAIGVQAAYVALTYLWLPRFGVKAVPMAYASAYAVVLVALVVAFRTTLSAATGIVARRAPEQIAI